MRRSADFRDPEARLLDAIYRGVTDTTQFERALELVGSQVGCYSGALLSVGAASPTADIALNIGAFDDAALQLYMRDFAPLDPAPSTFATMRVGTASTTDRLLTAETIRTNVFFNEFFHPLGLEETIGGLLSGNGRFEMLGLHRGSDREAFTDAELRRIEGLLPHLARALQLRRLFLANQVKLASLEATLDRMLAGIVVLDALGQGMFSNRAIQAIARRGDGLWLDRLGRAVPTDIHARKRLDALVAGVLRGQSGGLVAVPNQTSIQAYAVLVAPVPPVIADQLLPSAGGGVILAVHDPASRRIGVTEMVQEALNLPRGAAELAAALAGGHDLRSFAEAQGITIHTARFHLRTALARTGTTTQAGLTRLVVSLLHDLLVDD